MGHDGYFFVKGGGIYQAATRVGEDDMAAVANRVTAPLVDLAAMCDRIQNHPHSVRDAELLRGAAPGPTVERFEAMLADIYSPQRDPDSGLVRILAEKCPEEVILAVKLDLNKQLVEITRYALQFTNEQKKGPYVLALLEHGFTLRSIDKVRAREVEL